MGGFAKPGARRESNGVALYLALGYLAILMLTAGTFLTLLNRALSAETRAEGHEAAGALAEAGIEKALAELGRGPDGYRGEADTPLGHGRFSVEVVPREGPRTYQIVSTGELLGDDFVIARTRVTAETAFSRSGDMRELCWREFKRLRR